MLETHTFGIHLKVRDVPRSRRFYEALGLVPVFGFGDPDYLATLPAGCESSPEVYRGVIYRIAGAEYELAEGHPAVKPAVFTEPVPTSKVSAMLRVATLVPLLGNADLPLVAPVRHYYWGSVEAVLRDPDGFVVVAISTESPEELKAVAELVPVEYVPRP
jgi:catechol 2,3-dioxygenase-like lactoylglutathione lyase family enzyme